MTPSRVLIVADDRMASSRAIVVLGADSDLVVMTARPHEVQQLTRSFSPDIVVMDAASLDLVCNIRLERPKVPVLAVTSNPSVEQAIKALRVGASDYLETFTDGELRAQVCRLSSSFRADLLSARADAAAPALIRRSQH